jgi:WhiB family redox-sensing transcriptional regulator
MVSVGVQTIQPSPTGATPGGVAQFGRNVAGRGPRAVVNGGGQVEVPPLLGAAGREWQLWAACRGMDGSGFFHPDHESAKARAARIGRAKTVCTRCPVMAVCRAYALQVREPFGIWGGLSEEERHPFAPPDLAE